MERSSIRLTERNNSVATSRTQSYEERSSSAEPSLLGGALALVRGAELPSPGLLHRRRLRSNRRLVLTGVRSERLTSYETTQ